MRGGGSQPRERGRGRGRGHGRGNNGPNNNNDLKQRLQRGTARGQMKLELVPSISRSGGDDGLGDTLKDWDVQNHYWVEIQEKISAHFDEFPFGTGKEQLRAEKRSNILLLLRKLREGILATQRKDEFALKVYETSFYLAVTFESRVQASSSQSHLPGVYSALQARSALSGGQTGPGLRAEALSVVSLIFHLSEAFPSQATWYRQVKLFQGFCPPDSVALNWTSSVRASLNCRNYTTFETLTRPSRVRSVFESIQSLSGTEVTTGGSLVETALCSAVDALRLKLRSVVWTMIRCTYRELSLDDGKDTAAWLSRSLFLESVNKYKKSMDANEWMEQNVRNGLVVRKEGLQGRWILKR